MGQARARGSFEQRKAESIARTAEQKRLDEWFLSKEPKEKAARNSDQILLGILMSAFMRNNLDYQSYFSENSW